MSTKYRESKAIPNDVLADRLDEMKELVIAGDAGRITMRIPCELDHDGDVVMGEAARRLRAIPDNTDLVMAEELISRIEALFPNWKSYRDLPEAIEMTLHHLRNPA